MRATQVFMGDYYLWEIIGTKKLKTNYKYVYKYMRSLDVAQMVVFKCYICKND